MKTFKEFLNMNESTNLKKLAKEILDVEKGHGKFDIEALTDMFQEMIDGDMTYSEYEDECEQFFDDEGDDLNPAEFKKKFRAKQPSSKDWDKINSFAERHIKSAKVYNKLSSDEQTELNKLVNWE